MSKLLFFITNDTSICTVYVIKIIVFLVSIIFNEPKGVCIHATFFFCWVLIRAGLWRTGPILAEMADTARFRPKRAATMSPASILLLHGALCVREREREREIRVFASCALTWNYDRECKVESCGVDRFLNRCIGIRENLLKQ